MKLRKRNRKHIANMQKTHTDGTRMYLVQYQYFQVNFDFG